MPPAGPRTLVSFGFGAIGAGLFLYEAFESGNFGRLVVAEVAPDLVAELRAAGGFYSINIARADRVEVARLGPVEVCDPGQPADRERLVAAVAGAEELATAVPSVDFYASESAGSLHRVLAAGLERKAREGGPRAVLYAAENDNRAAEILEEAVFGEVPAPLRGEARSGASFLNTVIGKMSGLVEEGAGGLAPATPGSARAFLVEEFNRILVSRPRCEPAFERGIAVFEEKDDLLPFEEAKLYGHNAAHALAAYLGGVLGVKKVAGLREVPGFMDFLRAAFIEESGEALIRRHRGLDALFSPGGWAGYAEDLLARMTNPFLGDTVERVGRDTRRKLGWDDRLIGTIRLALAQDVEPRRYALGAAAALARLEPRCLGDGEAAAGLARSLWEPAAPPGGEARAVLGIVEEGRRSLRRWRAAGLPELERFLAGGG